MRSRIVGQGQTMNDDLKKARDRVRHNVYTRAWRARNREHVSAYNRLWRASNRGSNANRTAEAIRSSVNFAVCIECTAVKPSSEFNLDRSTRSGLDYVCRQCRKNLRKNLAVARARKK